MSSPLTSQHPRRSRTSLRSSPTARPITGLRSRPYPPLYMPVPPFQMSESLRPGSYFTQPPALPQTFPARHGTHRSSKLHILCPGSFDYLDSSPYPALLFLEVAGERSLWKPRTRQAIYPRMRALPVSFLHHVPRLMLIAHSITHSTIYLFTRCFDTTIIYHITKYWSCASCVVVLRRKTSPAQAPGSGMRCLL